MKLLRKNVVQTLLASLLCILLGLLLGFAALLIINPAGAGDAITAIVKNFWNYSKPATQMKNLGNTLVKTAPLLMCSLSVLFAYKVGLFNIGAAGQYVAGAGACIYCAVGLGWGWLPCMLAAIIAGAVVGAISGFLKAFRNVNEVISCIMLNWIFLYLVNTILQGVKEPTSNYTYAVGKSIVTGSVANNSASLLPKLGLEQLFNNNKYVTLAIPLAVVLAIAVWVLLNKTRMGYELRATGLNKNAAKYCGMRDRTNIVVTMAIAGGLAGIGAAMLYLTGMQQWSVTQASVPGMGFNGIAAAFLGGLNPIGAVFSSLFIQHITDGGSMLDMRVYSAEISDFISSLIIYLCGFVLFFRQYLNRSLDAREERALMAKQARKGGADK